MKKTIFRVGMIGCGTAAQFFHAPAYRLLKNTAKVVAIADPNIKNRKIVEKILPNKVKTFDSFEEMLRKENLNMIDVMVPHHLYVKIIPIVARYCKNILAEKPFAKTLKDAQIILKATKNINFSVIHNYLYGKRYQETLKQIKQGKIGKPYFVRLEHLDSGMRNIDPTLKSTWQIKNSLAGPGAFHNHGYHYIYLAQALMNSEITSVTASMGSYCQPNILDTAIVVLHHKNNGQSIILDGMLRNQKPTHVHEVLGTKGTLKIDFSLSPKDYFHKLAKSPRHIVLQGSPFGKSTARCIKDFITAVQLNKKVPITGRDAYRILKTVFSAYESYSKKRTISI